jgi:hypothetical protein
MIRNLALVALLGWPIASQADVIVHAPFVHVEVGPAVVVRAPFVTIVVPRTPPAPRVVPTPALPAPRPAPPAPPRNDDGVPPVPEQDRIAAPAPPAGGVKAISPAAFVSRAKPFEAGRYEVVLEHPHTGKPVKVAFELPVRPRSVSVTRDRIELRWGLLRGMDIEFLRDGGVRID